MTVDLDKLLELEAKATQGPWALEIDTAPLTLFLDDRFTELDRAEDIELISAMRNNIKDLCTELRAAREVAEAGMTIDLKELESSLISARTLLALEKVWKDKGEVIAYIKDWKKVIAELRAAREVVEAARSALDDMDVMFRTTERLEAALKTYDEARRE